MHRRFTAPAAVAGLFLVLVVGAATGSTLQFDLEEQVAPMSGAAEFRDVNFGTGVTECPQAGIKPEHQPRPLDDQRNDDRAEQVSQTGDEQRMNFEYSCFPQDETSIDVNPLNPRNAVGGANDYRLGWGTSGFYATTDNGNNWYGGIIPFPTLPSGDNLDGGGDPAIVYDRSGVVYYADINFNRTDDTNGIFVSRSTNGGYTWSRPCVPISNGDAQNPDSSRCGGPGDPRQPGDGVVSFNQDNDVLLNGSVPFDDKKYIAAGRRPANVAPQCFGPITRAPVVCPAGNVGPDRIYVTWTKFTNVDSKIFISYSDDRGRSWSPPRAISGSAVFCTAPLSECRSNQFSVPTVNPTTGHLFVAFENFNGAPGGTSVNQYLLVRSRDGGQMFEGPFFVTPVFDNNYPRGDRGRADCVARGQQSTRRVLTNSCFRVIAGGNVVVDRRAGEFADDLYLVLSDNRNGTIVSSNTDVFLYVSKDGGTTWIGPTRVNDDPSQQPANRNCGRGTQPPCPPGVPTFGNDQWFPWVDISDRGDVNVNFYDRRLDADSVATEWPTSRQRPGNYLVWRFGAICSVTTTATVTTGTTTIPADARQCIAPTAEIIRQPSGPVMPGNALFPEQTVFPLRNFTLSDVPSNWDYCFRAGIFCGDYDVVAIGPDQTAWAVWTDARNGRSSGGPTSPQPGRNPACEQSDAFVDLYSSQSGGTVKNAQQTDELFLVTPCPTDMQDKGNRSP